MRTTQEMLDEIENADGGAGPDPTSGYDGTVLAKIMDIVEERDDVMDRLRTAVADAREAGASWASIGSCLGVSKQAASKRYSQVA